MVATRVTSEVVFIVFSLLHNSNVVTASRYTSYNKLLREYVKASLLNNCTVRKAS